VSFVATSVRRFPAVSAVALNATGRRIQRPCASWHCRRLAVLTQRVRSTIAWRCSRPESCALYGDDRQKSIVQLIIVDVLNLHHLSSLIHHASPISPACCLFCCAACPFETKVSLRHRWVPVPRRAHSAGAVCGGGCVRPSGGHCWQGPNRAPVGSAHVCVHGCVGGAHGRHRSAVSAAWHGLCPTPSQRPHVSVRRGGDGTGVSTATMCCASQLMMRDPAVPPPGRCQIGTRRSGAGLGDLC
jgi:hypothetical protein